MRAACLMVLLCLGCYSQPKIPPGKPLSCSSNLPGECPSGFACVGERVCAPTSCTGDSDCPSGLTCQTHGCQLPGNGPSVDGGSATAPFGPVGMVDGGVPDALDAAGSAVGRDSGALDLGGADFSIGGTD